MRGKLEHLWSILTRTELWAAIAVIVFAMDQANAFPADSVIGKAIALGAIAFTALGYGALRTARKVGRDKAKAAAILATVASGAPPANPT